ncbi:MAG: biotin/lipoyl-binding protein [Natronospirillum sp.]|uniref:efflux RND transporter periplasmic adaptor subunit n=1 Tax=Natronospirillum sp. TaxID=2812955 RepID=UPI0025D3E792|nr:biotin/lipoyl-binding protein [Natronospirillum sp.]MCH8550744.1 biotin/lipoyl-binding protein [Natronospirillum sp.]
MLKRIVRIVLALLILGAAVGLAVWMVNGGPETEEDAEAAPPPEVTALEIEPGSYRPQMDWVGQVVTRQRVELTAPIAADVLALPVAEGDRVTAGESLIGLDTRELDWDLAQNETELRELELSRAQIRDQIAADEALLVLERELLAQAERALERERGLRGRGASTEAALEEAESRAIQARQSLRQTESALSQQPLELERLELQEARLQLNLERLQDRQQRTALAAPFDGIVESVDTSIGQQVSAGQPLVTLYAPESRVWRVPAPDRDSAELEARLAEQWVSLSRRAAHVTDGSASRYVEFPLPQALNWAPGETRSARVQRPALDNVQPVPASSLYAGNRVFLITEEEELSSVVIEPQGTTWLNGSEYWLISAGDLPASGRILVTRLPSALNGQSVSVSEVISPSGVEEP